MLAISLLPVANYELRGLTTAKKKKKKKKKNTGKLKKVYLRHKLIYEKKTNNEKTWRLFKNILHILHSNH